MSKSESGPLPISSESIGFLVDVKKGKPRKFAMICKGTSIVSLVVYKKGNVEQRKKEAKEAGKGQFYFGVVGGKGIDIRFMLARADGFESPPVKSVVLKNFLDESADLKCKPLFEIVDEAPLALDEDDPLAARFLRLQTAALAACDAHPDRAVELNQLCRQIGSHLDLDQTEEATARLTELETLLGTLGTATSTQPVSPAPDPMSDDAAAAFKARIAELLPRIKAAVGTPGGDEAKLKVSEAVALSRQQDFTQANSLLDEIARLLEAGVAPTTSTSVNRAAELTDALKNLKPLIDQVINADVNHKSQLQTTMAQIVGEIKSKQYDQADQHIKEFATLLQSLVEKSTSGAANAADPLAEFTARRAELEPRMLEAQKADPEKATKLAAVLNYADDQASASNFSNAFKALDKLGVALEGVLSAAAKSAQEQPDRAQQAQTAAPNPHKAKWLASFAKVEPIILEALQTNPFGNESGLADFRTAWEWAVNCAADGDYDKAIAELPKVLGMLKAAKATGTASPAVDVNPEVKPFAEARLNWRSTRNAMNAELKRLQDAISAACRGNNELQVVVDHVAELTGYLAGLDERLEDKLDQIVSAAENKRELLKDEARKLLDEYQQELDKDFFQDVDSQNGFVTVAVASAARSTLAEISRVLS